MSDNSKTVSIADILFPEDATHSFETHSDGPKGTLPFTGEILIDQPSGLLKLDRQN